MARVEARIRFLEVGLLVAVLAVLGRAIQLQFVQHDRWAGEANRQRQTRVELPARRGALLDRRGVPLAVTQEYYHVGIAPDQVTSRRALVALVSRQLDLPASQVDRGFAEGRKYIYFHGPFTAVQVQPLRGVAGVHFEPLYRRFYPAGDLARPIIGVFDSDSGRGLSGLESSLDSMLTGVPGEAVVLKDRSGREYESPSREARLPVPGADVTLTLDAELQEIAQNGLDEAVRAMGARGGDVVFLDPRTGEILALASLRGDAGEGMEAAPTTITEPFQPGSTAKLFTAAALLTLGLVDSSDRVFAEHGTWLMPVGKGRTRAIHDAHAINGSLTLAQAIQVSSNIAMAKFSARLTAEQQYEMLRGFGFGSPTAVEYPQEARGTLDRPDQWEAGYSGPSLAMGYEMAVTPLQLAAAYGAIANGGVLLAPTLVKEIRDPEGRVLYAHRPEPVRRVLSPGVVAQLRAFLHGAVGEGGTGEQAQLVNYTLLGKTGTAKRFENGRYVEGSYTASFAALFPATDPQLAVVVKIDDPRGQYYGGLTAGPVTRRMLDEALAARSIAINRGRLAGPADEAETAPGLEPEAPTPQIVVGWPQVEAPPQRTRVPVPATVGAPVRRAVLALHRRGFEVDLHGGGTVTRTTPQAGDSATTGATVTVWAE
jgi:cell division protein FtsI (penicillin-binding protein 3)